MRITTTLSTSALVASAAALLAILAATPASARPEPAPTPAVVQPADDDRCLLERVGTQFVRCDDLTGAGVPAPSYIPEPL
jgi:hypothetical protein